MSVKRYHTTLKAAREYIATQPTGHGLRIWPIKKATTDKILGRHLSRMAYEAEIARFKAIVDATPAVEDLPEIVAEDLAEYVELKAKIDELTASVSELPAADNSELTAKKRSLTDELDEVKGKELQISNN